MKKLSKFNHNLTPILLDRVQITNERTSIVPNKQKKKKIQYKFFGKLYKCNKLCMT